MEKSLKKAVPFLCVERPCGFDTPRATQVLEATGQQDTAAPGGGRVGSGQRDPVRRAAPCSEQLALPLSSFPRDRCPGGRQPSPGGGTCQWDRLCCLATASAFLQPPQAHGSWELTGLCLPPPMQLFLPDTSPVDTLTARAACPVLPCVCWGPGPLPAEEPAAPAVASPPGGGPCLWALQGPRQLRPAHHSPSCPGRGRFWTERAGRRQLRWGEGSRGAKYLAGCSAGATGRSGCTARG